MSNKIPNRLNQPRRLLGARLAVGAAMLVCSWGEIFGAASTDIAGNTVVGVVGWPVFTTASDVAGNRLDGILPGPFAVDSSDVAGNRIFTGALLPDLEGQGTEPTETPTPTNTPGDGETPTPTPIGGRDFDLWPVEAGDGLIDSRDLLELLKIDPLQRNDLFEFTEYWKTP